MVRALQPNFFGAGDKAAFRSMSMFSSTCDSIWLTWMGCQRSCSASTNSEPTVSSLGAAPSYAIKDVMGAYELVGKWMIKLFQVRTCS